MNVHTLSLVSYLYRYLTLLPDSKFLESRDSIQFISLFILGIQRVHSKMFKGVNEWQSWFKDFLPLNNSLIYLVVVLYNIIILKHFYLFYVKLWIFYELFKRRGKQ